MSELALELSENEKLLRNRFVEQYLIDYDALAAALRIGYSESFASRYANKFMLEPYTRNRITELEVSMGITTETDQHRKRIVSGLYREAYSCFNSGSARVAALTQLAKIVGIEAPVKSVVQLTNNDPDLSHVSLEDLESIKNTIYVKSQTTH